MLLFNQVRGAGRHRNRADQPLEDPADDDLDVGQRVLAVLHQRGHQLVRNVLVVRRCFHDRLYAVVSGFVVKGFEQLIKTHQRNYIYKVRVQRRDFEQVARLLLEHVVEFWDDDLQRPVGLEDFDQGFQLRDAGLAHRAGPVLEVVQEQRLQVFGEHVNLL